MSTPRLLPADPPYSAPVEAAFARVMPEGVPPLALFRTLARNERVLLRVMAGGLLDRGSLSLREREIIIDRTCFRCGSEYEWGVHVAFFGERAGLSAADVEALCTDDPERASLPARERLLLRACDELHATSTLRDETWDALAAAWSEDALVEIVVLAGFYHLISFATNAFRLTPEPFAARFPAAG
jgi:alkylhydroperoxidase family enzyme